MRIRVLYFASLREQAGCEGEELELPAGATVADALRLLSERHPSLQPLSAGVRFAVEREFADASHPLQDGFELALLPPVSGG